MSFSGIFSLRQLEESWSILRFTNFLVRKYAKLLKTIHQNLIKAEKFWPSLYIDISKRFLCLTIYFRLCLLPSYMSLNTKECCLISKWSVSILLVFDIDLEQSLPFLNNQQSKLKNFDHLCTLISRNDFFVWPYIFGCVSFHPIRA